jgi:hypothetical protein
MGPASPERDQTAYASAPVLAACEADAQAQVAEGLAMLESPTSVLTFIRYVAFDDDSILKEVPQVVGVVEVGSSRVSVESLSSLANGLRGSCSTAYEISYDVSDPNSGEQLFAFLDAVARGTAILPDGSTPNAEEIYLTFDDGTVKVWAGRIGR